MITLPRYVIKYRNGLFFWECRDCGYSVWWGRATWMASIKDWKDHSRLDCVHEDF